MLDKGLQVRDVRRAVAQTLKTRGAEKGVGAGPKTELVRAVQKQLRDLQTAQQKAAKALLDSCEDADQSRKKPTVIPRRCCAVVAGGTVTPSV